MFEVGQVVWDVRNGRGVVKEVNESLVCPVHVVFDLTYACGDPINDTYTIDGRYAETHKNRSLFFSEPVITAELFPPKKPFVPTLKEGDKVLVCEEGAPPAIVKVFKETEDRVYTGIGHGYYRKEDIDSIHVLGEEIKFS